MRQEIDVVKQNEEQLRKNNDDIQQQLKKACIDIEKATKLEEERIIKVTETEKRYHHFIIIFELPFTTYSISLRNEIADANLLLDRCIMNNSEEKLKLTNDIQRLIKEKRY